MRIDDLPLKYDMDLITISPDAPVLRAAEVLNGHNIGALLVCDNSGDLVGIISERDIVRGLSECAPNINDVKVSDLMTPEVVTCGPGDDVNEIMSIMDERRIRHIPVLKDNRLSAIISSRDVMSAMLEDSRSHCKTMSLAYEMVR